MLKKKEIVIVPTTIVWKPFVALPLKICAVMLRALLLSEISGAFRTVLKHHSLI